MVADARTCFGIPEGCDGKTACAKIGLKLRFGPLGPDRDGLLSEGNVVVNRTLRWAPRIGFTFFHEIFHYLVEEDGEIIEFYTDALRCHRTIFYVMLASDGTKRYTRETSGEDTISGILYGRNSELEVLTRRLATHLHPVLGRHHMSSIPHIDVTQSGLPGVDSLRRKRRILCIVIERRYRLTRPDSPCKLRGRREAAYWCSGILNSGRSGRTSSTTPRGRRCTVRGCSPSWSATATP